MAALDSVHYLKDEKNDEALLECNFCSLFKLHTIPKPEELNRFVISSDTYFVLNEL